MELLARREYAVVELAGRLRNKGFVPATVATVLAALQREGLLSDARFAADFVRNRVHRGYGPVRIRMELARRGVDEALNREVLAGYDGRWPECLDRARRKRFGAGLPADLRERQRQARFLQYRGFTADQIRRALRANEE